MTRRQHVPPGPAEPGSPWKPRCLCKVLQTSAQEPWDVCPSAGCSAPPCTSLLPGWPRVPTHLPGLQGQGRDLRELPKRKAVGGRRGYHPARLGNQAQRAGGAQSRGSVPQTLTRSPRPSRHATREGQDAARGQYGQQQATSSFPGEPPTGPTTDEADMDDRQPLTDPAPDRCTSTRPRRRMGFAADQAGHFRRVCLGQVT